MGPLFTQFVRSLEDTPDERLALAAWERLREILKSELKRRGLWHSPPSYLGIQGWPAWSGESAGRGPGQGPGEGALEELVADCYSFIFVDRLGRLQAQLRVKPNIEGLIVLNVRHFFLERQKEHDPLGYRVFEMVHAAMLQAIGEGELFVLSGDAQVRNHTVLGFALGAPEDAAPPAPPAPPAWAPLAPLVAGWNDELLPDLVMARGRRQEEVWARLRVLVRGLEPQGVRSFRFRDVLDPLKSGARLRWAALLEEGEEGGARASGLPAPDGAGRRVLPETPVESQESLEKLTRYVSAAVSRMPMAPQTREYLATLWQYLKLQVGAGEPAGSLARRMAELGEEERLSHRRLAQVLGIPRERLPGLFSTLRQLATQAQSLARSGRRGQPARPETPARPAPEASNWEEAG